MGRRALVTGGSRGIGKAAAAALLAEGAEVAIAARDRSRLDQAAADLGAAAGRAVPALQVDTGDDASVRRLVAAAQDRLEAAEIERRIAGRNLTRTLIDASQVAAVIAFLASPLSISINGECRHQPSQWITASGSGRWWTAAGLGPGRGEPCRPG